MSSGVTARRTQCLSGIPPTAGPFHGGPSTLTLHIILCSGDGVGEVCVTREFADSVLLRGSGPELVFG